MRAVPALLLLSACAAGAPDAPVATTAIYVPPVQLGGTGSVMFLPGSTASRTAVEEIAVVVALHRRLDASGATGCLNPVLHAFGIDDYERAAAKERLSEGGRKQPGKAAIRAEIIAHARESWGGVGDGDGFSTLDPAVEASLIDAYASAAMVAPRRSRETMLTEAMMPADVRLKSDCFARVSRPTLYGDWAFVGTYSATAGHLWALRRHGADWTLIAHRFTAIA